jgi:hypothetical protein
MYTFDWVVKPRVVPSGKPRVDDVGVKGAVKNGDVKAP